MPNQFPANVKTDRQLQRNSVAFHNRFANVPTKTQNIIFLDSHVSITSGSVTLYAGNEVVSEYLNVVG